MKRKFAILLATTLALNSFPAPAFAADDFDIPVAAVEEDADLTSFDFGDDFEGVAEAVEPEVAAETDDEIEEVEVLAEATRTFTVTTDIPDQPWTGEVPDLSEVSELATITVQDTVEGEENPKTLTLTRGTDFDVVASTSEVTDEEHKAYAIFTTKGNYASDTILDKQFRIVKAPETSSYKLRDFDTSSFVYNGSSWADKSAAVKAVKEASTVIKDGNTKLTAGDYSVDWTLKPGSGDGTKAGSQFEAVFKVGDEEFDKKTVTIAKVDLSKATLAVTTDRLTYDGTAKTPKVTAVTANELPLTAEDYSVGACSNNINAGSEALVEITAKSSSTNFTGTGKAKFTIDKYKFTGNEFISVDPVIEVPFTGKAQNPPDVKKNVKVYFENKVNAAVIPEEAYEIAYVDKNSTNPGEYKIEIKAPDNGNLTGTTTPAVGYKITKADISKATVTKNDVPVGVDLVTGNKISDYFTIKLDDWKLKGSDYTATYVKDNHSSVDAETVIKLTGAGTNFDANTSLQISYTAVGTKLADSYVSATKTIIYDGTEQRPDAVTLGTLTSKDGKTTLDPDNYIVTDWANSTNATTETSKATATIKGKDKYSGTAKVEFQIQKKPIDDKTVTVTDISEGAYFKGAEIKGAAVVLKEGTQETKLTADDVTVTAENIKDGYLTSVTVTVKGNYSSSKPKSVPVKVKSNVAALEDAVISGDVPAGLTDYEGADIKPFLTVTVDGKELTDFIVTTIDKPAKNNIKVGSTLNIKITAENAGLSGSKKGTVKVVKRDIKDATITLSEKSFVYNGKEQEPKVTVAAPDGADAITASDYTVSYSEHKNVGTVTVTVKATENSNYTGSKTANFEITKYTVTDVKLDPIPAESDRQFKADAPKDLSQNLALAIYADGEKQKDLKLSASDYTIKLKTKKIEKEKGKTPADKIVEYEVSINKDSQNYKAETETKTFTVSYPLVARTVVSGEAEVNFDKKVFSVNDPISVKKLGNVTVVVDGATLTAGEDYDLTIEKKDGKTWRDVEAEATVTSIDDKYNLVTSFKGYYSGTDRRPIDVGEAKFDVDQVVIVKKNAADLVYDDGTPKVITANYIGNAENVAEGTHYNIEYTDKDGKKLEAAPMNTGTYTATVYATANYGGAKGDSYTFTITPKALSESEFVDLIEDNIFIGSYGEWEDYRNSEDSVIYDGEATKKPICFYLNNGSECKEFEVVSWDKKWDPTKGNEGNAEIAVVKDGNYTYNGTYKMNYKWRKANLSAAFYSNYKKLFTVEEVIYDGNVKNPKVTPVEGSNISADWIKDCTYSGELINVSTNSNEDFIGKVTFTVDVPEDSEYYLTRQNGYRLELPFSIKPASIKDAKVKAIEDQVYTGEALRPEVVVEDVNGNVLTKGINYEVVYKDNTEVGEATVTITGIQNYKDSKEVKFSIVKPSEEPLKGKLTKLTPKKKTFKASDLAVKSQSFKITAEVNSGAEVSFKKVSGNKKITVTKSGKVTVKKGLKKGVYKLKVKLSAPATEDYTSRTVTRTINIVVK